MEEGGRLRADLKAGVRELAILHSHAHVVVSLNEVVIADSEHPLLVIEPGHPRRFYFLHSDVRMEKLAMTQTTSHCPLKGDATYYGLRVGEHVIPDIAWSYDHPVEGAHQIAGMIAFYNEKVDLDIDGERQTRPRA
jgi:uncharacterized protein (DUF427 family)